MKSTLLILSLFKGILAQVNNSIWYAPTFETCPQDVQFIRHALGLNPLEREWVEHRKAIIRQPLQIYLEGLNLTGFDLQRYMEGISEGAHAVPTLGLAISGGGYLSAYTGLGVMQPMDNRVLVANENLFGGLLQSLTYISGLSGGSFPTVSYAVNDFPTVNELVDIWQPNITDNAATTSGPKAESVTDIVKDLMAKHEAGFNTFLADLGRTSSCHRGAMEALTLHIRTYELTYSDIRNVKSFREYTMPMPILVSLPILDTDMVYDNLSIPSTNTPLYEMTPFEFGSWDGPKAFIPMEFLGTEMLNGKPVNSSACVQGFDKASFLMGTTASAVNLWEIETLSNYTLGSFNKRNVPRHPHSLLQDRENSYSRRAVEGFENTVLLDDELQELFQEAFNETLEELVYSIIPNPFHGMPSNQSGQSGEYLRMVDGSESGQTVPFWPRINFQRNLDFIIAWEADANASPYGWQNGSNLYATYIAANASTPKLPFPIMPEAATFVNRNYTNTPVLFGCNADLTTTNNTDSPIVLYLANAPYSAYTNYSFTFAQQTPVQMQQILENSFNVLTQGNGTVPGSEDWAQCVGCAVVDRSLERVGMRRTQQCAKCFEKWCWDGKSMNENPGVVDWPLKLQPNVTFAIWNETATNVGVTE